MATVIDRQDAPDDQARSRDLFRQRARGHAQKSIKQLTGKSGSITGDGGDVTVDIPARDMREPRPRNDSRTGRRTYVVPGNKEYATGDTVPKPQGGNGRGGSQGSPDGEGEDGFHWVMSRDEYLEYLYENCELPDLVRKNDEKVVQVERHRSGWSSVGPNFKLDLVASFMERRGRLNAAYAPYNRKILELLTEARDIMAPYYTPPAGQKPAVSVDFVPLKVKVNTMRDEVAAMEPAFLDAMSIENPEDRAKVARIAEIRNSVDSLLIRMGIVPKWNPDTDAIYRRDEEEVQPQTTAAMFCLMDVSGSVTESMKDLSKRMMMLTYFLLLKKYKEVDTVFIRHTSTAEEVDENTFFYSRETGSTVVSSALEKMLEICRARYPNGQTNIYGIQTSDGDNYGHDSAKTVELLKELLDNVVQAYRYCEVADGHDHYMGMSHRESDLMRVYKEVESNPKYSRQFITGQIKSAEEVFPQFLKFWEKKSGASPKQKLAAFAPG